jgi:hypothetical protein
MIHFPSKRFPDPLARGQPSNAPGRQLDHLHRHCEKGHIPPMEKPKKSSSGKASMMHWVSFVVSLPMLQKRMRRDYEGPEGVWSGTVESVMVTKPGFPRSPRMTETFWVPLLGRKIATVRFVGIAI